jgi:glutathione S-transferase
VLGVVDEVLKFLKPLNNMFPKDLLLPALATIIAVLVYFSQSIFVMQARTKHGVPAPKTSGNEEFDRTWRVHYNTLEQMPIFLPLLWIFSLTVSPIWGFILGILWSIGRIGYMLGYYKSTKSRSNPISYLSSVVILIFLLASLYAITRGLLV